MVIEFTPKLGSTAHVPPLRRVGCPRWAQHTSASLSFHFEQSSLDKVEATSVDVPYSSRAYRSDDEKSLLNQKETTRVPLLTKRSVAVGDCSEYTRVLGGMYLHFVYEVPRREHCIFLEFWIS